MVTKHAQENVRKYKNLVSESAADDFVALVNKAMRGSSSVAVVVEIAPTANNYRDDWKMNDRLVGIVRGGDLVTVMLSREEQINVGHLRTSQIWVAA